MSLSSLHRSPKCIIIGICWNILVHQSSLLTVQRLYCLSVLSNAVHSVRPTCIVLKHQLFLYIEDFLMWIIALVRPTLVQQSA